MTDSPNVESVKRVIERWNGGDRTPPLDEVDPDIEVHTAIAGALSGKPFRGYDGVREWLEALDEAFERWDIEPTEIRERGDTVVLLGVVHSKGRGSGLELDLATAWVADFRGGKTTRLRIFRDHDEALAAAGLAT